MKIATAYGTISFDHTLGATQEFALDFVMQGIIRRFVLAQRGADLNLAMDFTLFSLPAATRTAEGKEDIFYHVIPKQSIASEADGQLVLTTEIPFHTLEVHPNQGPTARLFAEIAIPTVAASHTFDWFALVEGKE